jgi:hypothetical protein
MPNKPKQASVQDYNTLGLTPDSSPAQVKKAYRDLVKLWHPDRFQQRSPSERLKAEERLKDITSSYRRISRGLKVQEPPKQEPESPTTGAAKPESSPRSSPQSPAPKRTGTASPSYVKYGSFAALILLLLLAYFLAFYPLPGWLSRQVETTSPPPEPKPPPKRVSAAARNWLPREAPSSSSQGQTPAPPSPPVSEKPDSPPLVVNRSSRTHFTLGSTEADVVAIQGLPTRIQGQTWIYGISEIQFKDAKVSRYNNFDGTLRVRLDPPALPYGDIPPFFTLGSTPNEVLLVQGTPTRIEVQSWFYGFSEIRFKSGRVASYDNYFGNLKVRLLPSHALKSTFPGDYFTVGSSRDEVLAVQGTPTSIQGNLWFYQLSNILFRDGRVQYVVNPGGNLRFAPPSEQEAQQPDSG